MKMSRVPFMFEGEEEEEKCRIWEYSSRRTTAARQGVINITSFFLYVLNVLDLPSWERHGRLDILKRRSSPFERKKCVNRKEVNNSSRHITISLATRCRFNISTSNTKEQISSRVVLVKGPQTVHFGETLKRPLKRPVIKGNVGYTTSVYTGKVPIGQTVNTYVPCTCHRNGNDFLILNPDCEGTPVTFPSQLV